MRYGLCFTIDSDSGMGRLFVWNGKCIPALVTMDSDSDLIMHAVLQLILTLGRVWVHSGICFTIASDFDLITPLVLPSIVALLQSGALCFVGREMGGIRFTTDSDSGFIISSVLPSILTLEELWMRSGFCFTIEFDLGFSMPTVVQ